MTHDYLKKTSDTLQHYHGMYMGHICFPHQTRGKIATKSYSKWQQKTVADPGSEKGGRPGFGIVLEILANLGDYLKYLPKNMGAHIKY